MNSTIKIPTIVFYCPQAGAGAFKSFTPDVPQGTRLEVVKSIVSIMTAAEEAQRKGSDQKDERRDLLWTWYGSDTWIDDFSTTVPSSAEKHLLMAVERDLAAQNNTQELNALFKAAGENYGISDPRPGEPGLNVFIVHGHDEKSLDQLGSFLEHRGYTPISLSRQPARGSETIVEMLERMLTRADLIIALFTADDEGRLRGGSEPLRPRVRQNVLVEAGFAVIQRRRDSIIVALGETEIPSDFDGIRRIEADKWNFGVESQLEETLSPPESDER